MSVKTQKKSGWKSIFGCFNDVDASKPTKITKKDFASAVANRRSIYALNKSITVTDDRLKEIVEFAIKWTPSSFNSQSGRAILLLGRHHTKFWNITRDTLKAMLPADKFPPTEEKMKAFSAAYGTVLFFEDQDAVKKLQEGFPSYAQAFPGFSEHSSGMLQFIVWTALEVEGLGASLQHYTPLVDEAVQKEWNVPKSWKLIAQMPFGNPVQPAGPKEFQPLADRVKLHK